MGGSHIAAALCRDDRQIPESIARSPYSSDLSADGFCELVYTLGIEAAGASGAAAGAQLAMPNPFDFAAGVSRMQHKLQCLYGLNLRAMLAERFGWRPGQIRFLHDAGAFLLGEIAAGRARGAKRAVGVTLGTGIGSAFSVSGGLITSGYGIPESGEIWNLPFRGGTVEDFLSSRGIQNGYQLRTGLRPEVSDLAAFAAEDAAARAAFVEFGHYLGEALTLCLSAFAPDVVVLGGGISKAASLFVPSARESLTGERFRLELSEMPDCAALVGAAVAWLNDGNNSNGGQSHTLRP